MDTEYPPERTTHADGPLDDWIEDRGGHAALCLAQGKGDLHCTRDQGHDGKGNGPGSALHYDVYAQRSWRKTVESEPVPEPDPEPVKDATPALF